MLTGTSFAASSTVANSWADASVRRSTPMPKFSFSDRWSALNLPSIESSGSGGA